MKQITMILLITMLATVSFGQDSDSNKSFKEIFDQVSFALKGGTTPFGNSFGAGIAEAGAAFNLNSNILVGFSAMGGLGSCADGYYNSEGVFVELHEDKDEDDPEDDNEDDENEHCESDELEALMGTFTYKFSEKIPVFVQIAAGYSTDQNAPAYTALLGYHQNIFSQLSVSGGIRFSEILSKLPADAVEMSRSGFKAELGLHWNF